MLSSNLLNWELYNADVQKIIQSGQNGDTTLYTDIVVEMTFKEKEVTDPDTKTITVSGLQGSYRPAWGFLFSGESLDFIQRAVANEGLNKLQVGSFWTEVYKFIDAVIRTENS
jgi:hypothetical protein